MYIKGHDTPMRSLWVHKHIEIAILCYEVKTGCENEVALQSDRYNTTCSSHLVALNKSSENRKNNNQESKNKWNIITNYQEETIINFTKWMEESIFEYYQWSCFFRTHTHSLSCLLFFFVNWNTLWNGWDNRHSSVDWAQTNIMNGILNANC